MSVTEYRLEQLLIYEELEKLRENPEEELIFYNARRIERVMKEASRYLRKTKRIMRAYE